jgi:hypothetical protein
MGAGSEQLCGGLSAEDQRRDECLEFLYGREYGGGRNVRGRSDDRRGGLGDSALSVPDWINNVHQLFPRRTIERLEKDALERYRLEEMVTNPDVLARAQPSPSLLKAVLRTKHLMNQDVLNAARHLVRQAVEELMKKLAQEVKSAFQGALNRQHRSYLKIARNFDIGATIRQNLRHYDAEHKRVIIETPIFYSRIRRQVDKWQIIILVDESGSMMDSVIHSAVTAAVFFGLKTLRTHLVIFDTAVVDLTAECTDPVETLMKVQLGGGTDIANAMSYAETLVENPRRTILILISDFFEGGDERRLLESGVTLLGLAALDENSNPTYDHALASRLVHLGAHVAAMTPGELAAWVAEKVRR